MQGVTKDTFSVIAKHLTGVELAVLSQTSRRFNKLVELSWRTALKQDFGFEGSTKKEYIKLYTASSTPKWVRDQICANDELGVRVAIHLNLDLQVGFAVRHAAPEILKMILENVDDLPANLYPNTIENMQVLLGDGRFDPNSCARHVIFGSGLAHVFFKDSRVNVNTELMWFALNLESYESVLAILPHIEPTYAMLERAARRSPNILALFLKDGRVDPSANDSRVLRTAEKHKRGRQIVKLLKDGRCDLEAAGAHRVWAKRIKF